MFIFPAAKFRANAYVAVVLGRTGRRKLGTFQARGVTERKNTISYAPRMQLHSGGLVMAHCVQKLLTSTPNPRTVICSSLRATSTGVSGLKFAFHAEWQRVPLEACEASVSRPPTDSLISETSSREILILR